MWLRVGHDVQYLPVPRYTLCNEALTWGLADVTATKLR